jgi:tetratricopeptide (TPR) repeat protein
VLLAEAISSTYESADRDFRRTLICHIESCLTSFVHFFPTINIPVTRDQARAIELFADVLAENGRWKRAKTLQENVVRFRESTLGSWHKETINAKRSLSHTLWNLFDCPSTIKIQLDIWRCQWWCRPSFRHWLSWEPNHLAYFLALDDLASTLWLIGRRGDAKRAGEKAVWGLTRLLGDDDPLTITAQFNLARNYLHLGDHELSRTRLEIIASKRTHYFGPRHPDTLMAQDELGMALCAEKTDLDRAESLVRNVLDLRKEILGREHAYTLWSVNDLSKILCVRGKHQEAIEMLESIRPTVARTLGEDHAGMVMTCGNLVRAYLLAQQFDNAKSNVLKLLQITSSQHPDWFHAKAALVQILYEFGEYEDAEKECLEALQTITSERIFKHNHPVTLSLTTHLIKLYHTQGEQGKVNDIKRKFPTLQNLDEDHSVVPRRSEGIRPMKFKDRMRTI